MFFKFDISFYKYDVIIEWVFLKDDDLYWCFYLKGFFLIFFRYFWYVDYDQYFYGVVDMVGYWVEVRIWGGVVLFD